MRYSEATRSVSVTPAVLQCPSCRVDYACNCSQKHGEGMFCVHPDSSVAVQYEYVSNNLVAVLTPKKNRVTFGVVLRCLSSHKVHKQHRKSMQLVLEQAAFQVLSVTVERVAGVLFPSETLFIKEVKCCMVPGRLSSKSQSERTAMAENSASPDPFLMSPLYRETTTAVG